MAHRTASARRVQRGRFVSGGRFQSHDGSWGAATIFDGQVDVAVWTLSDVAHPSYPVGEGLFLLEPSRPIDTRRQPGQLLSGQAADEDAAPPLGETVARVDQQS